MAKPGAMALIDQLRRKLSRDGIRFVLTQFVDLHGAAKVKMSPVEVLGQLLQQGAGFAGGAVTGLGQGPDAHDLTGRLDPASYSPLPWQPGTACFASDLYVDGKPHPLCPRLNLKRVLDQARQAGFILQVGIEPEHFLVVKNEDGTLAPWDPSVDTLAKPCYDYRGLSSALAYLQEITSHGNKLGWGVYQADHEDANGQFEVNFKHSDALTTADRYTLFRMMTAQVAGKYGAIATYMPKPFADRTGSGAHIHYHLAHAKTGRNIFIDAKDKRGLGLSPAAYHFMGGILAHARALCAIHSPTVNCYKRLLSGPELRRPRSGFTWTPAFISYGDNRTQMLRVCGPGHVEDRAISSACNPYLVFAAYAAAGLDGIANKIEPGEPDRGNLYDLSPEEIQRRGLKTLPATLDQALDALEADPIVLGALGPIQHEFLKLKRQEWVQYHQAVSPWEIDRYLTQL